MALLQILYLAVAIASAHPPAIYAHRGGPLAFGKRVEPENTIAAFRHARAQVIELDVRVSKDRVPFVLHDPTLDRTTTCTGALARKTAAEAGRCHIPRLTTVLAWARNARATLEIEPKESAPIEHVLDVIGASGVPKRRLLIESFLHTNLDAARKRGYRTVLVTGKKANASALSEARAGGYDVVSPRWAIGRAFVRRAHAAGKQVLPWTLDSAAEIRAAAKLGVDGIITNDPPLARKVLDG